MNNLNWPLVRKICGQLLLLESLFMLVTCSVSCLYRFTDGEDDLWALFIPTLLSAALGTILIKQKKPTTNSVSVRDGFFVVSIMWLVFSIFGMLPYLIYGTCHSVTDAFLETISGFTTTGCTVINDIDQQPHGILLWRSITQWIGGLGIVVFSLALLPKVGNVQMFSAEVTGISVEKLRPKIQATSRRLWYIYIGMTSLCCLLFWIGGMNLFDAVNHAMTTLATGGFSTHQSSIGYFHSPFIEYVCSIFLLLASVNFSLYYMVNRGYFRQFWRCEELRWFIYIVAGFTLFFVFFLLLRSQHTDYAPERIEALPHGIERCFRAGLFHVSTIISTCGFQAESYDYQLWGRVFWIPTLIIMAIGGCAGSTAGGIKVLRIAILIKNLSSMLKQQVQPRSFGTVMLDKHPLRIEYLQRTMAFLFLFSIIAVVCIIVLVIEGADMDTAIGTTISAIGNCGPGLGQTGPAFTWANLPDLSKWVLSFTMLIGRLELFTFILLFTPFFWQKR